jgi:hypothetical protein
VDVTALDTLRAMHADGTIERLELVEVTTNGRGVHHSATAWNTDRDMYVRATSAVSSEVAAQRLLSDLAKRGVRPRPPEDARQVLADAFADGTLCRIDDDVAAGTWSAWWRDTDRRYRIANTAAELVASLRAAGIIPAQREVEA